MAERASDLNFAEERLEFEASSGVGNLLRGPSGRAPTAALGHPRKISRNSCGLLVSKVGGCETAVGQPIEARSFGFGEQPVNRVNE